MRSSRLAIVAALAVLGSKAGLAQTSTPAASAPIGGKTSMDMIVIEANNPSVPLRNAGVVPQSETLELDGRRLISGKDYTIDYGTGMVYLVGQTKPGMALRATYTYDPARAQSQSKTAGMGIHGFKLNISSGASVMLNMGMADRKADGTILRQNLFGLKTNFGGGGLSLSGLVVGSTTKKVNNFNLLDPNRAKSQEKEGSSQAIVQQLSTNLGGGKATVDFQEIGRNFTGFSAFSDAGYGDGVINALRKEAGLKRTGFALDKIGSKSFNLSASSRSVRDGNETVDWRTFGAQLGGLTASISQSEVGSGFKRFADLADGDRDWLARERGLKKSVTQLGWGGVGLKLNAQSSDVADQQGNGVIRQALGGQFKGGSFNISKQNVDQGFTQFQGLRDADAGQLARERGLERQSLNFDYSPVGKDSWKVNFAQAWVRSEDPENRFQTDRVAIQSKKYGFERVILDSTKGFSSLGNLAETELQSSINSIAQMYEKNGFGYNYGQERQVFVTTPGLKRELNRFNADLGKGATLQLDQLQINGANDAASVFAMLFNTKNAQFKHSQTSTGTGFMEASTLMNFEKGRLGPVAGVDKRDDSLALNMGKSGTLAATSMEANKGEEGSVKRDSINFNGKGVNVSYTQRDVDQTFTTVNQLADPERDLLQSLKGYRQNDLRLSYTGYKGVVFNMIRQDSLNKQTDNEKSFGETGLSWQPDKFTNIGYYRREQTDEMPGELVFKNLVEKFDVARQFGKYGAIALSRQQVNYDGTATKAPDSDTTSWSATVNLNPKTSVTTSHVQTDFSNGGYEKTHTNTVATQLSPRTGVSVSDVQVRRDGDLPDEERQDLGFWYDFGGGLRLNYGYKRDMNTTRGDIGNSSMSLTPGTVGNIKVDQMGYGQNTWEAQRYQGMGNVALGLVKPMQLGPLRDFTFRYSADTARDYGRFLKENRVMNGAAKIGTNTLGYDYMSQIAPTGERAIDRTIRFSTDQNPNAKLRGNMIYKVRTMPNDKVFAIRNFDLTWNPVKGWTLTHLLQTNPEVARGDLLLGSLPQASRTSKWKLDFNGKAATTFGLTWDELINDQTGGKSRVAGVNMTLNAKNPSPVVLWYGLEYNHQGAYQRTAHRYSLRYDQKPGANQLFSLFLGNVSWEHSRDASFKVQNWSARMEYQLKW